ncbi:MAG TPA: glycoside hydrolase family 31 protein, partial [Bacteroidales bacterium]|nr:glycoside hydrolase family 31 protein [Bacteroidales bacterium]
LRYTLMPYIYTLAGDSYHKDYTIMRPLVMDFAHDTKVLNIDNQYMFGPSFLVNPVTEFKATKRDVYLPDGQAWYDLYTGNVYHGGQTISADAPYERMPVFVKEGSIIPTGVDMQYTNQYPDSIITLYVYAGKDASFELYADESTNYNYEKGKYSYVPISYNESTGTLTIGERRGVYDGMLQNQTFKIVYINAQNPVAFGNKNAIVSSITYSGSQISTTIK